jgi:mannose-6-phosphate isomerase-like protein (cupin superfamily)
MADYSEFLRDNHDFDVPEGPDLAVETWYQDEEQTVALIILNGLGSKVRNRHSDMTYKVVSGRGSFSISSGCNHPTNITLKKLVNPGDEVTIPKGKIYVDEGNLVMLATAKPPFDEAGVEYLR